MNITSCADLLSTNFFLMEADCNHRFTDWAFNLNNTLNRFWIRVKQPFIFTTWTSHMHFLHSYSPPDKRPAKRDVKLTVDDSL